MNVAGRLYLARDSEAGVMEITLQALTEKIRQKHLGSCRSKPRVSREISERVLLGGSVTTREGVSVLCLCFHQMLIISSFKFSTQK